MKLAARLRIQAAADHELLIASLPVSNLKTPSPAVSRCASASAPARTGSADGSKPEAKRGHTAPPTGLPAQGGRKASGWSDESEPDMDRWSLFDDSAILKQPLAGNLLPLFASPDALSKSADLRAAAEGQRKNDAEEEKDAQGAAKHHTVAFSAPVLASGRLVLPDLLTDSQTAAFQVEPGVPRAAAQTQTQTPTSVSTSASSETTASTNEEMQLSPASRKQANFGAERRGSQTRYSTSPLVRRGSSVGKGRRRGSRSEVDSTVDDDDDISVVESEALGTDVSSYVGDEVRVATPKRATGRRCSLPIFSVEFLERFCPPPHEQDAAETGPPQNTNSKTLPPLPHRTLSPVSSGDSGSGFRGARPFRPRSKSAEYIFAVSMMH